VTVAVEIVGWLGAACLLLAYGLLSTGRLRAGLAYQSMNLAGSIALALNGIVHRALPSVAVNVIWLFIGAVALKGLLASRPRLRWRGEFQSQVGVRAMDAIDVKSFDKPDETRPFKGKGMADVVNVGGRPVARGHFEPGWKWSVNLKPIAGTELCEIAHFGYVEQGRMRIHMKDGTEQDLAAGEVAMIPPGHDAEVMGDETCVFVDFGDIAIYAKPKPM
jgi:hypothetical protein